MKVLLILMTIFTISCGKHEAKNADAKKVPVDLKFKSIQAFSLENHSTQADTFTFFFFPKVGKINWKSSVFQASDSDEVKLSKVVARVLNLSRKIDDGDEETYRLTLENKDIQKQIEENNCNDEENDGDISEDIDFGDGAEFKTATSSLCEELTAKLLENMAQADQLSSVMKSDLLRQLQTAIDNVQFVDEDGQVVRNGNFENWQEYGDANEYAFDLRNPKEPFIYMPTVGKYQNTYSSKDGSIYDIELTRSPYDPNTQMLLFKMKEKGLDGAYTGYVLEAELEKVNFAGKVRFTGDIFKKTSKGSIVQHGVMKFELAENEDIDTGDDW